MTRDRASPDARTASAYSRCSSVRVGVEQQPAHPDHAVERRADLVAHVRDELGLHARGLDGLLVGTGQLFLRELVLSEIREREADHSLEVHVEDPGADPHGYRAVLGADQLDLDRAPGPGSPAQGLERGVVAIRDERGQRCGDDVGERLGKDLGQAPVGIEHEAILGHRRRPVAHVLDEHAIGPVGARRA